MESTPKKTDFECNIQISCNITMKLTLYIGFEISQHWEEGYYNHKSSAETIFFNNKGNNKKITAKSNHGDALISVTKKAYINLPNKLKSRIN